MSSGYLCEPATPVVLQYALTLVHSNQKSGKAWDYFMRMMLGTYMPAGSRDCSSSIGAPPLAQTPDTQHLTSIKLIHVCVYLPSTCHWQSDWRILYYYMYTLNSIYSWYLLSLLKPPQKRCIGPHIQRMRGNRHGVVEKTSDLCKHGSDELCPLRNVNA